MEEKEFMKLLSEKYKKRKSLQEKAGRMRRQKDKLDTELNFLDQILDNLHNLIHSLIIDQFGDNQKNWPDEVINLFYGKV